MNFPETRWTLICQLTDPAKGAAALDQLCAVYWEPIYAYLLHSGWSRAEAQDLTQEFLGMMVSQHLLERADPVAGKLRAWLMSALRQFVVNAQRHRSRLKRGGGVTILPLDQETLPELEEMPAHCLSPDEAFDRAWIDVLLRRVLEILVQQYRQAGRENELEALLPFLLDGDSMPQAQTAAQAGLTVANFRVQLHRLRGRYREILRQEICATLEHEENCQEELAYLFRITSKQI